MSKKYEKYTIGELITDPDFIQWSKYPTDESDLFWQSIAEANPEQSTIIFKARSAVKTLIIAAKQNVPLSEIPTIWSEIEENIIQQTPWYLGIHWKHWTVAATIFILFGIGYWWSTDMLTNTDKIYVKLTSKSTKAIKEIVNTTQTKLLVLLPDGSKVVLEPNSQLSYHITSKDELREVYLSGEAFFTVKKDPTKPFLVYANALVTKVLGTSFSVRAYRNDKNISVNVKSGKVSVYQNNLITSNQSGNAGVVLSPNQQVIFGKSEEKFTKKLVEKPIILLKNQESINFSFKNVPIEQIFSALEQAYGIDIIYDRELMSACRLTTSVTKETLFEKLDIICAGLDATYKVLDAQIIINSKGCN